VLPHPLDDPGVVVAVSEIVIERREAVLLASLLHVGLLGAIEREVIDIAPVNGCGIHRETRRNRSLGADDHVILPGAAVPLAEPELTIFSLHNAGGLVEHGSSFGVGGFAVPIPANFAHI